MHSKEPEFKTVFKDTWENLPPVFLKRYANRPYSNDLAIVEGKMDVSFSRLLSVMMPILKFMHILVPYQGKDIPVTVDFRSATDSDATFIDRKFYFPGKPDYTYNSCVHHIKDAEVIELMSCGLGWRINYYYDGEKVIMQHKGYILRLFGYNIPLPLEIFIGKGHAEETVIDENSFRVTMSISHRLFGTLFSYAGNFTFTRQIT